MMSTPTNSDRAAEISHKSTDTVTAALHTSISAIGMTIDAVGLGVVCRRAHIGR